MTQKERLLNVFDADTCSNSKAFRYTLIDQNGVSADFESINRNRFKSIKRFIRKRMDDNLNVIVKGVNYRLIGAEIVDSVEDEYFNLASLKPVNK